MITDKGLGLYDGFAIDRDEAEFAIEDFVRYPREDFIRLIVEDFMAI